MASGAAAIGPALGDDDEAFMKASLPAADDLCSTAAPTPRLMATSGKTPALCSERSSLDAEALDGDSFALPEGEESGSDSEEEGSAAAAMARAVRHYVLAGARPAAAGQPGPSEAAGEEASSESEGEVLNFRLAVRHFAQRVSRRR